MFWFHTELGFDEDMLRIYIYNLYLYLYIYMCIRTGKQMLRLMFSFFVHILISMDHGLGMEMCEETHSETLRVFDATSTVLQKNTLTRPHCKCQQHRNNLLQLGSRNVQPKVYRCMNGFCHLPIEC